MGCCSSTLTTAHDFQVFCHPSDPPITIKHILLIVNPYSGGRKGIEVEERAIGALQSDACKVDVYRTERPGHALEIAATTDLRSYDAVCTIGGDGTVHETVNGLLLGCLKRRHTLSTMPMLGIIPCGSGNTIAYTLGYSTEEQAFSKIKAGVSRSIDVLQLTKPPSPDPKPETPTANADCATKWLDSVSLVPAAQQEIYSHARRDSASGSDQPALARTEESWEGEADAKVDEVTLEELRQHIIFSVNMIGYGLGASVLHRADGLRWMGKAQYDAAAAMELFAKPVYRAQIDMSHTTEGHLSPIAECNSATSIDTSIASADHNGSTTSSLHVSRPSAIDVMVSALPTPDPAKRGLSGMEPAAHPNNDSQMDDVPENVLVADNESAGDRDACNSVTESASPASARLDGDDPVAPVEVQHVIPSTENNAYNLGSNQRHQSLPALEFVMLQIQTTVFMGEKMAFCPQARLDDGLMDIVIVKNASRAALLDCMSKARKPTGNHVNLPFVEQYQASEITLTPIQDDALLRDHYQTPVSKPRAMKKNNIRKTATVVGPKTVNVDGELIGFSPVRIQVLHRALRVLC